MTTPGERFALLEQRLGAKFGSTVTWRRDTIAEDPADPTNYTVTATATYQVIAQQAQPDKLELLPSEITANADMVLVLSALQLAAAGLPADALSGQSEVTFQDSVVWRGRSRRVLWMRTVDEGGGVGGPVPTAVFVGLGA